MLPVVQTGTPHLTFVEREAERLDEMQRRAGGETGAPGVSGIPMNFRIHEHHVQWR